MRSFDAVSITRGPLRPKIRVANFRVGTLRAFLVALSIAGIPAIAGAQAMPNDMTGMAASPDPAVGGAAMYPSKNIVQNAVNSKDHTTLVSAVKAAGLVTTLEGPGPFTVFAPTNEAFAKLPAGTVATLVKPENKAALVKILTYHVVAGRYSAADLLNMIHQGGGHATLTTVEGEPLTVTTSGSHIVLTDAKGGMSDITIADVNQSNGVIHVVDGVLIP
jgi:uncharacterized surface protein with fasciclin (FAS1) repeats